MNNDQFVSLLTSLMTKQAWLKLELIQSIGFICADHYDLIEEFIIDELIS